MVSGSYHAKWANFVGVMFEICLKNLTIHTETEAISLSSFISSLNFKSIFFKLFLPVNFEFNYDDYLESPRPYFLKLEG